MGLGGLGSPAALYLAAAGVGTIRLVDPDRVELSNLHRQILYSQADVGRLKVDAASARLLAANPHIQLEIIQEEFRADNAFDLLAGCDVVLDGTDQFSARYLIADACYFSRTPNVHAAVYRFEGRIIVFSAGVGPCYRCLFPYPPVASAVPNCADAGVLGALPGVVGSLQAIEALKLLLRAGESLIGKLLLFDALAGEFRSVRVDRRPQCPLCGERPTIRTLKTSTTEPCPDMTAAAPHEHSPHADATVEEIRDRRAAGDDPYLVDIRWANEIAISSIQGSIHIPLDQLPNRLAELDPSRETILYCKSGGRSSQAAAFLRAQGYTDVRNLRGGILEWIDRIEPHQQKY